ncbi:MAG: hypothetical protein J5958_05435, partial [Clostridia bacterium]|nr:hypothetical protein [Clostridia bacterium]
PAARFLICPTIPATRKPTERFAVAVFRDVEDAVPYRLRENDLFPTKRLELFFSSDSNCGGAGGASMKNSDLFARFFIHQRRTG